MTLTKYPVRGQLGLASVMAVLKLILFSGGGLCGRPSVGLPKAWTTAMVLTASVPTASMHGLSPPLPLR